MEYRGLSDVCSSRTRQVHVSIKEHPTEHWVMRRTLPPSPSKHIKADIGPLGQKMGNWRCPRPRVPCQRGPIAACSFQDRSRDTSGGTGIAWRPASHRASARPTSSLELRRWPAERHQTRWCKTFYVPPGRLTQPELPIHSLGCRLDRWVIRASKTSTGSELDLVKSGNSFAATKDIEEIQRILPHRYPFLLVDRVVELELQSFAVGYKNVTANDNFFTGHFPDRKIMPGVLQVEALAQLGGIVMMDPQKDASEQQNFFFGGIEACKFRRPVVPGDTLMMRVELVKFNKRFGIAKINALAFVGQELCCEAELTLVLAK